MGPKHIFVLSKATFIMRQYTYSKETEQHEMIHRFLVAIGTDEYPTPSGVFTIKGFAVNPDWRMPDSPWVPEELRGTIIPGGHPDNPLIGAFMDFGFLGVGIHGTNNIDSLGTRASHGCIRVRPWVARHIADLLPNGSKVAIL